MNEGIVSPSLSSDLITMMRGFLTEESSPGIRHGIVGEGMANLVPISSDGLKDWYEDVRIQGWIWNRSNQNLNIANLPKSVFLPIIIYYNSKSPQVTFIHFSLYLEMMFQQGSIGNTQDCRLLS